METEPVAIENTSSIGEGENKKPKVIDLETDLTSPPAKKLKQARLPFKVLTPKLASSPVASCQKKRKFSSEQSGTHKQAKTLRNNNSTAIRITTADSVVNETGSSSELEDASSTLKRSDDKSKYSGLLDRFVRVILTSCDSNVKCDHRDGVKERQAINFESGKQQVDCVSSADTKSQVSEESLIAAQSRTKEGSFGDVVASDVQCSSSEQSGTSEVDHEVSIVENLNGSGSVPAEISDDSSVANALATQDVRPGSRLVSDDVKTEMTTDGNDISLKSNVSLHDKSGSVENDCVEGLDDSQKEGSSTLDITDSSGISVTVSQSSSPSEDQQSADDISEQECTPKQAGRSSSGHQSSDSTPKTSRSNSSKKNTSSSRRNSDTQKEKELAKLEKRRQREAARAEKERQRLEAKAKKEQERLEAKRKKEEEKLRLQKEREEKLQQKEEEKRKKQLEREEERRRRQELIDAKNEEKKRKDEERLRAEEELKLKKEKEKALFTKFFTKSEKPPSSAKSEEEKTGPFIAFEVKDNMRLAPEFRIDESAKREKAANVDKALQMQNSFTLYLEELKQKSYKPGCSSKTWPLNHEVDIEIIPNNPTYHLRAKLLQFHENYRPAYYGTWRKHSCVINPRNPLQKDQDLLDYEVDSDEEWEEEEPGESLSHSEGEGSDDEKEDAPDDEDEDDGFFVPHGYLSEGEGCEDDDEDMSPERLKARQLAKAKAWESEMKRRKLEVLRPVCIGCLWADLGEVLQRNAEWDRLQQYSAIPLVNTPVPVNVTPVTEQVTSSNHVHKERGTKFRPVPKEAIPDLIRLVHGNVSCLQKLVKEFIEYWRRKSLGLNLVNADNMTEANQGGPLAITKPHKTDDRENAPDGATTGVDTSELGTSPDGQNVYLISKRQLMSQIRELAVYEKQPDVYSRYCWYVQKEILEKYGLSDLTVPTKWQWLTHSNASKKRAKTNADAASQAQQKTPAQIPTNNIRHFAVTNLNPSAQMMPHEKKTLPIPISPHSVPPARQRNLKTSTPIHPRKRPLTPSSLVTEKPGDKIKANEVVTSVKGCSKILKAKDSIQKTLVAMFSPPQKQKYSKVKVQSTTPSSVSCLPGDSEESPMLVD